MVARTSSQGVPYPWPPDGGGLLGGGMPCSPCQDAEDAKILVYGAATWSLRCMGQITHHHGYMASGTHGPDHMSATVCFPCMCFVPPCGVPDEAQKSIIGLAIRRECQNYVSVHQELIQETRANVFHCARSCLRLCGRSNALFLFIGLVTGWGPVTLITGFGLIVIPCIWLLRRAEECHISSLFIHQYGLFSMC